MVWRRWPGEDPLTWQFRINLTLRRRCDVLASRCIAMLALVIMSPLGQGLAQEVHS